MNFRVIAFYLPQFHPIRENDECWGKGFTEWTNVTRAKPLFKGHYQPRFPADLGFYDLRLPEIREAQAALARQYGIAAFCYWHYWFGGEQLLERPFQEVLESGKPDFPFCLGWANETWSGIWSGGDERKIIKEQTYPGIGDFRNHFKALLTAFLDPRYVRVDGKPLFLIYRPLKIPDCRAALDCWRQLAQAAGLPGLHLVAHLDYSEKDWDARAFGFDAVTVWPLGAVAFSRNALWSRRLKRFFTRRRLPWSGKLADSIWPGLDRVYDYAGIVSKLNCPMRADISQYPMAVPNWDTTARYGRKAIIFHNSDPELFRLHFRAVLQQAGSQNAENRIVFLKSWNEWAEGNYVEPDLRFGHGYLRAIKEEMAALQAQAGRLPDTKDGQSQSCVPRALADCQSVS
jgi:lipopolysaccharide biosynthesis protein